RIAEGYHGCWCLTSDPAFNPTGIDAIEEPDLTQDVRPGSAGCLLHDEPGLHRWMQAAEVGKIALFIGVIRPRLTRLEIAGTKSAILRCGVMGNQAPVRPDHRISLAHLQRGRVELH